MWDEEKWSRWLHGRNKNESACLMEMLLGNCSKIIRPMWYSQVMLTHTSNTITHCNYWMIRPRLWINNKDKMLCSSVALESIILIKAPDFLSDDPIFNNNQRLTKGVGVGGGSRCLDMQLCESCRSEEKTQAKKLEPTCQIWSVFFYL